MQRQATDGWDAVPNPLIDRRQDPVVVDEVVIVDQVVIVDEVNCFEPVCGVTIELFADIARAVAARDDDAAHGSELARQCGISAHDWQLASKVWNSRIASEPAVAGHLMALYRDPHEADGLAS
jgi:hypothetical protein